MQISTLIPNRNDSATLERSVRSACDQNPHEVLVLDDCSTDDSVSVVRSLQPQYPQLSLWPYAAKSPDWLRALFANGKVASGDYVHFLAADDYLLPGFYDAARTCDQGVILAGVRVDIPDTRFANWFMALNSLPPGKSYRTPKLLKWACDTLPSGTGAIFRKDVIAWMNDVELWRVGPWNDSVGIPISGWLFGVDHVPGIRGVHCFGENRYGTRHERDEKENERLFRETYQLAERLEERHGRSPELAVILASSLAKVRSREGTETAVEHPPCSTDGIPDTPGVGISGGPPPGPPGVPSPVQTISG